MVTWAAATRSGDPVNRAAPRRKPIAKACRSLALASLVAAAMVAPVPLGEAAAQTTDPSFRLTNNSAARLNEIYVSSLGVNSWGPGPFGGQGAQFRRQLRRPAADRAMRQ